ncbi:hypothetical protein ACFX2I_034725 [Malus domestica]
MWYSNGFNVDSVGRAGCLSLWWEDSITVEVMESSKHFIDARCSFSDSYGVFRFTEVYGTSYWRGIIQKFSPENILRICGGDFNELLWDWEKLGGVKVRYNRTRYLEDFMSKMDDEKWAIVLGSNHCPILVQCEPNEVRRKKIFRFEAFWAKEADCVEVVKGSWEGIFYHSYWDIIVKDMNELVEDLMNGRQNPNCLNATHAVLIPKVQNQENVNQFCHIRLSNYSYKVLSKVMANWLKQLMPTLISTTQNAFVAGRQIQDNIGIAHEIFHFLKLRKTKRKFKLGIKLDMHKAYDRVEWDFLMTASETKKIEGVQMNHNGLVISHLFFADDTLIFLKAEKDNCKNLVRIIDEYCSVSGQQVNLYKSNVFFGRNVPVVLADEFTGILGMEKVENPGVYLGVPASGSIKEMWAGLCDRASIGENTRLEEVYYISCMKRSVDQGCGTSYSGISDEPF